MDIILIYLFKAYISKNIFRNWTVSVSANACHRFDDGLTYQDGMEEVYPYEPLQSFPQKEQELMKQVIDERVRMITAQTIKSLREAHDRAESLTLEMTAKEQDFATAR